MVTPSKGLCGDYMKFLKRSIYICITYTYGVLNIGLLGYVRGFAHGSRGLKVAS